MTDDHYSDDAKISMTAKVTLSKRRLHFCINIQVYKYMHISVDMLMLKPIESFVYKFTSWFFY